MLCKGLGFFRRAIKNLPYPGPVASTSWILTNASSGNSKPRASSLFRHTVCAHDGGRKDVPEDRVKDLEMVVFRKGLYFREERLECLRVLLLFEDWSSPNGNRISCEILCDVRTAEGRRTLVVFDLVGDSVINRLKHYSVRSRRHPTA